MCVHCLHCLFKSVTICNLQKNMQYLEYITIIQNYEVDQIQKIRTPLSTCELSTLTIFKKNPQHLLFLSAEFPNKCI